MRSKVQKQINEASKVLGNLTDKQLEQYVSEGHKLQNKERARKGGDVTGRQHYENGTGLFARSKREIKKDLIKAGKATTSLPIWKDIASKGGINSAKSSKHPNNTLEKCKHCGFETTLPLIRRWHNDNCKLKKSKN